MLIRRVRRHRQRCADLLTLRVWFDRGDPLKKCYGHGIVGQMIWPIRARPVIRQPAAAPSDRSSAAPSRPFASARARHAASSTNSAPDVVVSSAPPQSARPQMPSSCRASLRTGPVKSAFSTGPRGPGHHEASTRHSPGASHRPQWRRRSGRRVGYDRLRLRLAELAPFPISLESEERIAKAQANRRGAGEVHDDGGG